MSTSIDSSVGAGPAAPPRRASAWISRGLESLQTGKDGDASFDVLIVGSGYGGAVAADRISARTHADGRKLRIAVLERGREYLRGAFPSSLAELAGHVRFTTPDGGCARGRLEGLFDMRLGKDVSVLVANGVGGGSLINAGVMLFPPAEVFAEAPWPRALDYADLEARARRLRFELGASRVDGSDNVLQPGADVPRRDAMRCIDGGRFREVPLTIALRPGQATVANVALEACIHCGDCASGCNHGAKNSLDLNLLRRARQRGVAIYTGATVSRIAQAAAGEGWVLEVWHTDLALRRRMEGPLRLRARRVVLAAGALGSTELLLRSRSETLQFSKRLGHRFSGNGDMLAALYAGRERMHAVADESQQPSSRGIGPTISGMLDWRDDAPAGAGCLVQDLAVPGALRRVFEETTATADLLHRLTEFDGSAHAPGDAGIDPCAVDPHKVEHSTVVAIIARDAATGVLSAVPPELADERDLGLEIDPGVHIDWSAARDDPRIDATHQRLAQALRRRGSVGGRLLPNPAFQLLPASLEQVLGSTRGALLTVHPLGGCAMGTTRADGVVDHLGRIFDRSQPAADAVHEGLVVLDGAIVPTSLGVNPALTIAVLADRAIDGLCGDGDAGGAAGWMPQRRGGRRAVRPSFVVGNDRARPAQPTQVEVVERLSGVVQLQGERVFVELSLAYFPTPASMRGATLRGQRLLVRPDPQLSRLRIFRDATPPAKPPIHPFDREEEARRMRLLVERADKDALLIAPVANGSLRMLHREASGPCRRVRRAGRAWLLNRGLRDIYQEITGSAGGAGLRPAMIGQRLRQTLALASRAGEVRRFDCKITLGRPDFGAGLSRAEAAVFAAWRDRDDLRIIGHKRVTYARGSSPIAQLMRMTLTEFGGLRIGPPGLIEVSPSYFARAQVPLLRVVQQQDLPTAYADLAGLGLYIGRVLLNNHLWSFRKPDAQSTRAPQRLPGPLPGLPVPQVHLVDAGDGVDIRLTVYPRAHATRPPVLMIHGYSASGTTFAHPSLPCSLAEYLWRQGAEPWIVDLRSSCGMPTAQAPWTFEDMAERDIPAALEFVRRARGGQKIDVVSHCMGSAMLAMALLGRDNVYQRMEPLIRRWVMSQITPAMVFSPANMLRAYLLQYALNLLPGLSYPISGNAGPTGFSADAFDRLLAALPYLGGGRTSEFEVENPLQFWRRTPWVGTRHRLDALFGRVFDARRLAPQTLEHIDDFFGEINLATVSQTIHFARNAFVSSAGGSADAHWDAKRLQRLQGLPTLSLHARNSGLADWETVLALQPHRGVGGWDVQSWIVEDCGHQDLLIGRDAKQVFERIDEFLRGGPGPGDDGPAPARAAAVSLPRVAAVPEPSNRDGGRRDAGDGLAQPARGAATGARYVAEAPRPLDQDDRGGQSFFAAIDRTPSLLLVLPFKTRDDGVLQPVDKSGEFSDDWIAAAGRVEPPPGERWTHLRGEAGWRAHADLKGLGLDPDRCEGGLVLFIVERRKTGAFGAPVADAAAEAIPDEELRAAVQEVLPPKRLAAALRWR